MNEGTLQQEYLIDMGINQQAIVRPSGASGDDLHLLNLLRSGNEAAFVSLIDRYHSSMLRLAMVYVSVRMVAEEVVQETWLAVLEGLNRFEGRSSLQTWMFRILTNCAKTRAQREGRSVAFSSLPSIGADLNEPAVDPDRFQTAEQEWPGNWASLPSNWQEQPEQRLLSQEIRTHIEKAIAALPPSQREVIILRDIEGWTSEETCRLLGLSEANQRVLLHRARSKVRRALEKYFEEM